MVPIDRIEHGLARFMDMEVLPALPKDGISRVITGAAMAVVVKRVGSMIRGYGENAVIRGLGVIDESGNVDIDVLRDALRANVPDAGIKIDIPLGGTITLHRTDVDTMYRYITE